MVMNGVNPALPTALPTYSPKPQQFNPLMLPAFAPSAPSTLPQNSNFASMGAAPADTVTLSSAVPSKPAPNFLPLQPLSTPASPLSGAIGTVPISPTTPASVKPLTPAEQTGKQVGDIVTKFLNETPALQEKIQHIDWDALSQEDLKPKVEKYRAAVQQALKHVPKIVDRKLIRLLEDPKNQELGTQFDTWLRKEPDPEVLADLHQPKVKPSAAEGLDDFEVPSSSRRHSSLDDETGLEDEPPTTLRGKVGDRVKETYSNLKERFSPDKPEPTKAHLNSPRAGRSSRDEMNDADLEKMLSSLSDSPSRSRGHQQGHGDSPF